MNNMALLEVKNLSVAFNTENGKIQITDKVSFSIEKGEIYGLVGESGCGKSVTAYSILKILPQPAGVIQGGEVLFQGEDILTFDQEKLARLRGESISMIFQEPGSALNPLVKIKRQLLECFEYHTSGFKSKKQREVRVIELLKKVGFSDPQRILNAYPHELSGGMLQRVVITMALLLKPKLIIADEPTTALDVTVQAQIMELLVGLQKESGCSILLITHNLNLIAQYADRLGVMYAGRIVEECSVDDFVKGANHPYTKGLLKAIPNLDSTCFDLKAIPGQVPQPKDFVKGCRFYERCEMAFEACRQKPELKKIENCRKVACFLFEEEGS